MKFWKSSEKQKLKSKQQIRNLMTQLLKEKKDTMYFIENKMINFNSEDYNCFLLKRDLALPPYDYLH
jgi:hypothetical protein